MREYFALSTQLRGRFNQANRQFREDLATKRFRSSLRVKGVQGREGVYELSWGRDLRAMWTYGPEVLPGHAHIIWLRIGTHDIFRPE